MGSNKLLSVMRKHYFIVGILISAVVVVYFVSQYGQIEVSSGDRINYSLRQNGSKITTEGVSPQKMTKVIKKGEYELLLKNDTSASLHIVNIKGFFQKASVRADFKKQVARKFVGENPKSCPLYGDILYSYECNTTLDSLVAHMPATTEFPTQTINNTAYEEDVPLLSASKDGQAYIVTSAFSVDSDHVEYYVNALSKDNLVKERIQVEGINAEVSYFSEYKDGFIAFDEDLRHIFIATIPEGKTKKLNLNIKDIDDDLKVLFVKSANGTTLIGLNNNATGEQADIHDVDASSVNNLFIVIADDKPSLINLVGKNYFTAEACGKKLLCALSGAGLDIIDYSGRKPVVKNSIADVSDIKQAGDNLLVLRGTYLFSFSPSSLHGHAIYDYGDYKPCGLYVNGSYYLMCIIHDNQRQSLLLNPQLTDSDNVDKTIVGLKKLPQVEFLSVYEKIIMATPYGGEYEYNPAAGGYIKNENIVNESKVIIESVFRQSKLHSQGYQLIFTSD